MGDYKHFRFKMQHIFPLAIFSDFPDSAKAGLTVKKQGNLMARLKNPKTAAALRDAPQAG